MKVALLHYSAPPVVGGVESVLGHHARLLASAGHQVRILAGRGAQTDERVPFVHIPLADSRHPQILEVKASLDAGRLPEKFHELSDLLLRELQLALEGVEVLICHNVCSLSKNLPLTTALRQLEEKPNSPRLVLWHHDLAWTTPRYRAELHPGFPWELLRQAWPGAIQVTVSDLRSTELSELFNLPEGLITVVPNGIDTRSFLKLESWSSQVMDDLGLLSATPLLLLPVRITPRKNIELALKTLAVLQAEYPRAALVVTGPLGPHNPANTDYFARLIALRRDLHLEKSAIFLAELSEEYLPDAVVADFYRLADALIFPSREEGFGIPVLEAGLAGLPVFCADIPPLRALGGEEASYFSPEALASEVAGLISARLAADPVYRLKARVKAEYTWEQVYSERIAPLLLSIIE
ncbi:MAG TPA: glycosyltransferase [Anaerolineales bacterium]|nr:glycosyltransferase [Anaerolineales bacterium]